MLWDRGNCPHFGELQLLDANAIRPESQKACMDRVVGGEACEAEGLPVGT